MALSDASKLDQILHLLKYRGIPSGSDAVAERVGLDSRNAARWKIYDARRQGEKIYTQKEYTGAPRPSTVYGSPEALMLKNLKDISNAFYGKSKTIAPQKGIIKILEDCCKSINRNLLKINENIKKNRGQGTKSNSIDFTLLIEQIRDTGNQIHDDLTGNNGGDSATHPCDCSILENLLEQVNRNLLWIGGLVELLTRNPPNGGDGGGGGGNDMDFSSRSNNLLKKILRTLKDNLQVDRFMNMIWLQWMEENSGGFGGREGRRTEDEDKDKEKQKGKKTIRTSGLFATLGSQLGYKLTGGDLLGTFVGGMIGQGVEMAIGLIIGKAMLKSLLTFWAEGALPALGVFFAELSTALLPLAAIAGLVALLYYGKKGWDASKDKAKTIFNTDTPSTGQTAATFAGTATTGAYNYVAGFIGAEQYTEEERAQTVKNFYKSRKNLSVLGLGSPYPTYINPYLDYYLSSHPSISVPKQKSKIDVNQLAKPPDIVSVVGGTTINNFNSSTQSNQSQVSSTPNPWYSEKDLRLGLGK